MKKIYYRGYVISEETMQQGCTVEGRRPERQAVAFKDDPMTAMRWVDQDVLRQRVADAGWLAARLLSA